LLEGAGFDVRVVGQAGLTARVPIEDSQGLIGRVRGLPNVARVAAISMEMISVERPDDRQQDIETLVGASDAGAAGWTVIRGHDLDTPEAARERCPLVVGQTFAAERRLEPGATLRLRPRPRGQPSALPPVACTIVAVAEFMFAGSNDESIATTSEAFGLVSGGSRSADADIIMVLSKPDSTPAATVKAIQALRGDIRVYSNDDVVAQFNQNGFAYFRQISIVLSSVTMVFAFLLVATLLTVSINQRLGEIAALRALGISRSRIASMLLWESALLVGIGGVLAVPLGEALAQILDHILKQMPGLPDRLHFFVFEPRAVGIHAAVLVVTAIAAAAYPIWLTARLPIAATLRREVLG
jgi:putative ABC transport system permease protein